MMSPGSWAELMATAIGGALDQMPKALPARVESFDASTRRISAQPLIRAGEKGEDGERTVVRYPVITEVPVAYPGTGPYQIEWPLAVGDVVLLVFCSGSLDKWLEVGGEVDPLDDRRHAISDAVAFPCLRSKRENLSTSVASGRLTIEAPEIHAGGSDQLATKADIDDLRNYIANTMVIATPSGNSTPGTFNSPPTASGTAVLKGG